MLGADVAVLDVNLGAGRPSGLDAYAWLRDQLEERSERQLEP